MIQFFLVSTLLMLPLPSASISKITLSPTAIGLVLLKPSMRKRPLIRQLNFSPLSARTEYQLPVDLMIVPFIRDANIQMHSNDTNALRIYECSFHLYHLSIRI